MAHLEALLPEVLASCSSRSPFVREGSLTLFRFVPHTLQAAFQPYLHQALPLILDGLSDESEGVRDAALAAGRTFVELYAQSSLQMLLPAVEAAIYNDNWRIRQASVELCGELLFKVGRGGCWGLLLAGLGAGLSGQLWHATHVHARRAQHWGTRVHSHMQRAAGRPCLWPPLPAAPHAARCTHLGADDHIIYPSLLMASRPLKILLKSTAEPSRGRSCAHDELHGAARWCTVVHGGARRPHTHCDTAAAAASMHCCTAPPPALDAS